MPVTSRDRPVLTATDLSPAADRAADQAAGLAASLGCELYLLHVFNDGVWATLKALYLAEHWAAREPVLAARERLTQLAAELAVRHGIRVSAETRTGSASAEIAAFARELRARVLVAGEHGENRISEGVIGGTALKMLGQAGVPVLLARRPVRTDYSVVMTATDFSDNADRAARYAVDLFPAARHILLHAYSIPFEGRMRLAGASSDDIDRYRANEKTRAETLMREQIARLANPPLTDWRLVLGFPAAAVLDHSNRLDADLIVIGKHGGPALEERVLGSVTRSVLYQADCDVLVVP